MVLDYKIDVDDFYNITDVYVENGTNIYIWNMRVVSWHYYKFEKTTLEHDQTNSLISWAHFLQGTIHLGINDIK